MTEEKILHHYWDVFLSHLCEFHPLQKTFIEKYEYELDWSSISKNRAIDWDLDFLKKYEPRFAWGELALNEGILWTEEKIDCFKKRLDWHYLSRNANLPISEPFIQKYSKKISVIESNPLLDDNLIKKYGINVLPKNDFDTQTLKINSSEELEAVLNSSTFHHNQKSVYENLVIPLVEKSGVEQIFEKQFDYTQRYYFLQPVRLDANGLTPEFKIDGDNPFDNRNNVSDLLTIDGKLTLVNGPLQEGPDRLYEVPRFSLSGYTTLLVSENVKSILDQFKLPGHVYHEVILKPKKLTTTTKFFILQVEPDSLSKDLDYQGRIFFYSFKDFKKRGNGVVEEPISSQEDMTQVRGILNKKHSPVAFSIKIVPDSYVIKTDYDLYSYSVHGKMIINQFLKDALEKNFPGQMTFVSAQLLRIKIDQDKYDAKSMLPMNTKLSSKVNFRTSDDDKFFYAKMERLENHDAPLSRTLPDNDKFGKKELELNVIFPKVFKDNYLKKRLRIEGYDLLPISKFYVQNEFSDKNPETYKSVVIAENGVGDSINLILERESDYQLQNRLFEFLHETGEYQEI